MPAKNFAALVATFALFAATAPAHAAYVETLDLDHVVFSGGDTVNGHVYINTHDLPTYSINSFPYDLSVDGMEFENRLLLTSDSVTALFSNGIQNSIETLAINLADLPSLSSSDFTLTNYLPPQVSTYGVSGEVYCVSGCSASAVPLPDALPMFATALLAFAGFAARAKRAEFGQFPKG